MAGLPSDRFALLAFLVLLTVSQSYLLCGTTLSGSGKESPLMLKPTSTTLQENQNLVTLVLTLQAPVAPDNSWKTTYGTDIEKIPEAYRNGVVFLIDLFASLDPDSKPRLSCRIFTESDMFGGCSRSWDISTGRFTLRRELFQEIRESWSSLEVQEDVTIVPRLPAPRYLEWNGSCNGMELTIGNVAPAIADALAKRARVLFAQAGIDRQGFTRRLETKATALCHVGLCLDPVRSADSKLNTLAAQVLSLNTSTALKALTKFRKVSLSGHPGLKTLVPIILEESPLPVRLAAIEWLEDGIDDYRRQGLRHALLDEHQEVSDAALAAICRRVDSDSVPAILHAFQWGALANRQEVLQALKKLSRPPHAPLLDQALGPCLTDADLTKTTPEEARLVMSIVGQFADPVLANRFSVLQRHPDTLIREAAVWALGMSGEDRFLKDIQAFQQDPDEKVRNMALHALTLFAQTRCRKLARVLDSRRRQAQNANDVSGTWNQFTKGIAVLSEESSDMVGDPLSFSQLVQTVREREPDTFQYWLETHGAICQQYELNLQQHHKFFPDEERPRAKTALAETLALWARIKTGEQLLIHPDQNVLRFYDYRFDLYTSRCEPRPVLLPFLDPVSTP